MQVEFIHLPCLQVHVKNTLEKAFHRYAKIGFVDLMLIILNVTDTHSAELDICDSLETRS